MALPVTFGPLSTATMAQLDQNFAALGKLTVVPCTVVGTNALTLTPLANTPTVAAYANYMLFSGVVAMTNTTAVTARVGSLAILPVYKDGGTGPIALTGAELVAANSLLLLYDGALASGAGGFHLVGSGSGGSLGAIGNGDLVGNISGGAAAPVGLTLTQYLDAALGSSVQGDMIFRGPSSWIPLVPNAIAADDSGKFLYCGGPGVDLRWRGISYRNDINITATGTTQADAYQIINNISVLTSTPVSTGVVLFPQQVAARSVVVRIFNRGGNTVNVYPQVGGQINALGTNNPDTIANGSQKTYVQISPTLWYSD